MEARFQRLGKDLFWEILDEEHRKSIKWIGYDDIYWWENVAKSEHFQIIGKYRLNPFTNEVSIVKVEASEEDKLKFSKDYISRLERVSKISETIFYVAAFAQTRSKQIECPHGNIPVFPSHAWWCDTCFFELEEALFELSKFQEEFKIKKD
jgi:hypothetical protein